MNDILGTGRTFRFRVNAAAAVVAALVALPLCSSAVNPFLASETPATTQQARLEALRRRKVNLARTLAGQRIRLGELRNALKTEKIQLESARGVNRRIARLTNLAGRTGLAVNGIVPGEAVHAGRYDTVPIQLWASGKYPTCAAFLHRLRETFPDTSVRSLKLSGNPERPGAPTDVHVDLLWHTAAGDPPEKK